MSDKLEFTRGGHQLALVISIRHHNTPDDITYSTANLFDVSDALKELPSEDLLQFLHRVLFRIKDADRVRFLSNFGVLKQALEERDRAREDLDSALVVIDVLKGQLAELEKGTTP